MTRKLLILIILIVITYASSAQRWNQRKYEFYYGIGATNFNGDIAAPTDNSKRAWVHFYNTMGIAANTGIRYNFKNRHYVRGSLYLGQMYASDPADDSKYWYRGLTMNSFFTDLTVRYEFLVLKEKNRRTVYRQLGESKFKNFSLPTYLFIGAGGVMNVGTYTELQNDITNSENYFNIGPTVTYGLGFKFRVNRTTYVNLELSGQTAISDGLDNAWKGKDSNRIIFGDWYDQYQFISFNVIHKLKSNRKGLPKFKKR